MHSELENNSVSPAAVPAPSGVTRESSSASDCGGGSELGFTHSSIELSTQQYQVFIAVGSILLLSGQVAATRRTTVGADWVNWCAVGWSLVYD
jgi:hypothetical protein